MNDVTIYDFLPEARKQLRLEQQMKEDYLFGAINQHQMETLRQIQLEREAAREARKPTGLGAKILSLLL